MVGSDAVNAQLARSGSAPVVGRRATLAELLRRPELFVGTFAEKLQTYALGRGVEYYDAPAIRTIVRDARAQNFRISSIILGIVKSKPFQMRASR